ncbi:deoxynucleotidyltransferase terminal-interacting protein 1-like isoform X2 [Ptychodera flava]|uniref:deoxynucleotidyltransferase terminal-interacting protein 1-like isoform X2 n=1 Tax=Ptychodera flava TaxID=63121 RepID=UPI003969DCBC
MFFPRTVSQLMSQHQPQQAHHQPTANVAALGVRATVPGNFHTALSNPLTALLQEPVNVPTGYPGHLFAQHHQNKPPLAPPPPPSHTDFARHTLPRFPAPQPPAAHHHVAAAHHHILQQYAQGQKVAGFASGEGLDGSLSKQTRPQHMPPINMTTEKPQKPSPVPVQPAAPLPPPPPPPPEPKMVEIPNPFCLTPQIFPTRVSRLVRTEESHYNTRNGGCINPAKALDLLRAVLQSSINKEIKKVMDRYRQYFDAAAQNVKENYGEKAVTEANIMSTFQDALEQAKEVFKCDETSSIASGKTDQEEGRDEPAKKKFKPLTEASFPPLVRKRKGRPPREHKPKPEPVRKDGPKWDPNRLNEDTLFVMGARANKALGLGATRGRLYSKHPELFKYAGDQEDKQWLYENGLMPATGGKAFILIVEDMYDLSETDEYKNNPELCLHEIRPFKVNKKIMEKMKAYMRANRTDGPSDNQHE